jgi:hypothetical protein
MASGFAKKSQLKTNKTQIFSSFSLIFKVMARKEKFKLKVNTNIN